MKWLSQLKDRYPRGFLLFLVVLYFCVYFLIGALFRGRPAARPAVFVDAWVPLAPWWVFIYAFVYFFAFIPAFVVHDLDLYRRTVRAYFITFTLSFVCFLLYPTIFEKPTDINTSYFAGWALAVVWFLDTPGNCLPSLHVATAFVSSWSILKVHRTVGRICLTISTLIAISTLYTKQHYILDVVFGFGIAAIATKLTTSPFDANAIAAEERQAAPRRALGPLLLYLSIIAIFLTAYLFGVQVPKPPAH